MTTYPSMALLNSSLDGVDFGGSRGGVALLEEALRVHVAGMLPTAGRTGQPVPGPHLQLS